MKPEIKTKWVEALRSGKYVQGEGDLKSFDNYQNCHVYCCLGVLTELYAKEKSISFTGKESELKRDGEDEFLCEAVIDWSDAPEHNPSVLFKGDHFFLSDLNDGLHIGNDPEKTKLNFNQIADLIEQQL